MPKKSNLKSVRISDEVMEYIFSCEGNGFNQKFENIVLFCMKEEARKRSILKSLDAEIQQKYRQLGSIRELPRQVDYFMNDLKRLHKSFSALVALLENSGPSEN